MSGEIQRSGSREAGAAGSETHPRSATTSGARVVVISPEADDAREFTVLTRLFSAGLQRYHMRKHAWPRPKLHSWLRSLPPEWRNRIVLHQHHELVPELGLGGVHFRDGAEPAAAQDAGSDRLYRPIASRSCHDLGELRAALGRFDSVFFSPVFPSISKPGYAPRNEIPPEAIAATLANRTVDQRRTTAIALGGISAENASRALELGFDGVAALGAIWQTPDPVRAFTRLQESLACHAT